MKVCKQVMEELFWAGESVACGGADGNALCIISIDEDHVRIQSFSSADGSEILKYGAISAAVNAAGEAVGDQPDGVTLRCFVAEYLRRAEQARRDAEVDAMWLRAGACQIQ